MGSMKMARATESWLLSLRSQRKSERTQETYLLAVNQLSEFLDDPDITDITRHDIRRFLDHMLTTRSDSTARQRYGSLSVFFKWIMNEEEIVLNPMDKVSAPSVEDKPIDIIGEPVFQRFLDTCDGSFKGRRDKAVLWLLWDTGIRLGEIASIRLGDYSTLEAYASVRGKTGPRKVYFSPKTSAALNRYERIRDSHKYAHLDALWIGERGALTDRGISQMLTKRAIAHDLPHIHPHQFRHTAVDRFLSDGVNEGDVMSLMGWSKGSRSMLDRYGAVQAEHRAFATYRRLYG